MLRPLASWQGESGEVRGEGRGGEFQVNASEW